MRANNSYLVTTVIYDTLGRKIRTTNALGQSVSMNYDAKSRPTQVTTRDGQSVTMGYDSVDRLTHLDLPEGSVHLGYDATGNLTSASSYNGSSLLQSYDANDRIASVGQTLPNGFNANITYTYDANGNRTQMATPWGTFRYTYDSLDRIVSITNPNGQTITFSYDALGQRTSVAYPNGIKTSYAYDASGQVTQILHQNTSNQTAIAFDNYTYDANGNRTNITDMDGTHSFSYDKLNRLTSANHSASSILPIKNEMFSYDPVGNRSADSVRGGYSYDAANRIVGNSSFTYTTDPNGNVTSKKDRLSGELTSYVYNSSNQLIAIEGSTSTIATYKYDVAGNRIEKNVGGTITRYIYDGKNVLAILDGNNAVQQLFTQGPGIDVPLEMRSGGNDYYFHADALGSVNALTDSGGAVVETVEYQAFGQTVVKDHLGTHSQSTVGNSFLFTARELDAESGLYFYRMRHYDVDSGRFMQEDAIQAENLYAYAAGNPTRYSDSLGMWSWYDVMIGVLKGSAYLVGGVVVTALILAELPEAAVAYFLAGALGLSAFTTGVDIGELLFTHTDIVGNPLSDKAMGEKIGETIVAMLGLGAVGIGAGTQSPLEAVGQQGGLFRRGQPGDRGIFNEGPVRAGWGWDGPTDTGRNRFRVSIGNKKTKLCGVNIHIHLP